MYKCFKIINLIVFVTLFSCNSNIHNIKQISYNSENAAKSKKDTAIVDCNYTFEEAVSGTKAPKEIVNELQLINVRYFSVDNKIHKGQILVNKKIAEDVKVIFEFILKTKFQVAHVIPIVKYNWNDNLSMQDNNSYSFCYRNADFSKHATGMAIDINPFFNPVCWKQGYENRINKPVGAKRDTTINGTFYSSHPVLKEFRKLGFFLGHQFKAKYDDHHFQK